VTAVSSHFIEARGVTLHAEVGGSGRPVVLLHGFTGSVAAMAQLAGGLRDSYRTISIDLVGHGRSEAPRSPESYAMSSCVEQIASVLDALRLRDVHLVGYSMGGRAALALCAAEPGRVASALLIGAAGGIGDPDVRAARIRADTRLAEQIERDGISAFVDFWMAQPFVARERRIGSEAFAEARRMRLANRPHALAASLRGMGAGAQPPLLGRLASLDLPICLVVGEEDAKFCAIASELARELPNARIELVPDAGHAAHLENAEFVLSSARHFFAEVDTRKLIPDSAADAVTQHSTRAL
jgi:2-succinyl-6-hydroxy-2,4-cyclohexadiene-1-carboxylate synthase